MPSTYSTSLRLELMADGEKDDTWGGITNTNLGTLIESAIAGVASVTHDDSATYSLTSNSGSDDEARHAVLNVTGTLTAARNLQAPSVQKVYIVKNGTSGGFAFTLKTSGGTGISIPNGETQLVYCDGTEFYKVVSSADGNLSGNADGAIDMNGSAFTADTITFNEAGEAAYLSAGSITTDRSYDETTARDIAITAGADFNIDFETPNSGMGYSHVLWITQDGTGGRTITIRDGSNTEATWLGTEPAWSSLAASALTIVSVFYAPSGTLYAVEVTQ